jgi:hypothetical protein
MKTQNGFTLLESEKEFKEWLDKQYPTRKITRLQVHHMGLPDYSTWNNTDKRVYGDNRELGRTMALDSYGKTTWGSSDGYGHYIAQHFNIFPNGKVTTGRNLNSTPIGIKGWNANAICIEIYGNFDIGQDTMTEEQKKAVIFVFALLAKKFNLPINSTYIRPHAWFTSGGTCLWDYYSNKSRKTCPGTNFMGFGNTRKAFENNFYPLLKKYKYGSNNTTTTAKTLYVKIKEDINMHSRPDFTKESTIGIVTAGGVYTVIEEVKRSDTNMYRLKSGVYITASPKYVETFKK